jgi:alpha-mannosidase
MDDGEIIGEDFNMKDKTLHMIGNAHIDPVWLWQWQEGFHEVKATFRSALDRMDEFEDFVFVSSSAAFYEWVEQSDPAMFAEIQQRVAEGRWQIVGGWWIQPDCNLPGGESFIRQALYGQRYFKEKFGVTATVGYNVDSFGHHGMLPQLLKKSGLDYYVFLRPMPHEKGLPGRLFWWEADDGSRVLAFRIPYEYCTWGKDLDAHVRRCLAELKPPFSETLCFYGVGNHGGGPTVENLESIRRMAADPEFPNLRFSAPEEMFRRAAGDSLPIPVVHDDLQHHAAGCYAAHSGIKRWNRRAENTLLAAERFSAIAAWTTGQPYPADFARAWKDVLFNQFHDILAGTSLEAAYEDARDLYGEAMSIAGRGLNYAIQSLAWNLHIPAEPGKTPIVVFNPHAWASRVNVEMEFGRLGEADGLLDSAGQPVPLQRVQSWATANGRNRISFIADLPPMGYATYFIAPGAAQGAAGESQAIQAGDDFMENRRFRLEFDPQGGTIRRLFDKVEQVEVFAGPAAAPVVLEDPSDTWAHNVFQFNREAGRFTARSVRLVACGPVKAVIRVASEYGASRLIQDFTMYPDLETIEVQVTLDWREQFKALKLRFPLNLSHMRATYEIPYGHKERFASGEEEPGQSWVDLSGMSRDSGAPYGFSLLNDGKYSFDVNIRDIGLTVLRSPIYAHHIPAEPDPEGHYAFIDQGLQRFGYALLPHSGSWEEAGTVRRAAELNLRPIPLAASYHPEGTLPLSNSFVSVNRENLLVSVLKQAEQGDDLILRCVETSKEATRAEICLPYWQRAIEADFGPCEIKTFRIPRDRARPIVETNLLEWSKQG